MKIDPIAMAERKLRGKVTFKKKQNYKSAGNEDYNTLIN
jgi:hypothetical protein